MSTIGAVSRVTGNNKSAFLRINNRHTHYDTNLGRTITAYRREYIFKIAGIDYERKELKTFLKRLYQCESDKDPFAKKYLKKDYLRDVRSSRVKLSALENDTLPEIEEVQKAQKTNILTEPLKKNTELPALTVCHNTKKSKSPCKGKGKSKKKVEPTLPTVYEDTDQMPILLATETDKTAAAQPTSKKPKVETKTPNTEDKKDCGKELKTTEGDSSRRSSQSKELPLEDPVLQFLPGRNKIKPTKMDIQVRDFCDELEKFKHNQMAQGDVLLKEEI